MIDKETLDKAADAAERTNESWGGWEDVATAVLEAAGYSELQAYARDLEARIERGLAACDRVLNNEDGHKPPGPPHPTQQQATAVRIRAALTATEGQA